MDSMYYVLIILGVSFFLVVLYIILRSTKVIGPIPIVSDIIDPILNAPFTIVIRSVAGRNTEAHNLSKRKRSELVNIMEKETGKTPTTLANDLGTKKVNRYDIALEIVLNRSGKIGTVDVKATQDDAKKVKLILENPVPKPKGSYSFWGARPEFELVNQHEDKDGTINMMFDSTERQRSDIEEVSYREWEESYAMPTQSKVETRLKNIKGVKDIEVGEKGHIYVEIKRT